MDDAARRAIGNAAGHEHQLLVLAGKGAVAEDARVEVGEGPARFGRDGVDDLEHAGNETALLLHVVVHFFQRHFLVSHFCSLPLPGCALRPGKQFFQLLQNTHLFDLLCCFSVVPSGSPPFRVIRYKLTTGPRCGHTVNHTMRSYSSEIVFPVFRSRASREARPVVQFTVSTPAPRRGTSGDSRRESSAGCRTRAPGCTHRPCRRPR